MNLDLPPSGPWTSTDHSRVWVIIGSGGRYPPSRRYLATLPSNTLSQKLRDTLAASLPTSALKSSRADTVITCPGTTPVLVIPAAVSSDKTGWYDLAIPKETAAKTGHDATGRKLKGSESAAQEVTLHAQTQSVTVTFDPPAVPGSAPPRGPVAHTIGRVEEHVG